MGCSGSLLTNLRRGLGDSVWAGLLDKGDETQELWAGQLLPEKQTEGWSTHSETRCPHSLMEKLPDFSRVAHHGRRPLGLWSQIAWVQILVLPLTVISVTGGILFNFPMPEFSPLGTENDSTFFGIDPTSPASAQSWIHHTPSMKSSCHFQIVPAFYSAGFPICMFLAS